MSIRKIEEGIIDVPKIPKSEKIKRGIYILVYEGKIIKVGIFGEGVSSNNISRFASYRNMGRNISNRNGSFKTLNTINENLKVGEEIEVRFKELPDDIFQDGYWWKVDLYYEEKKLKDIYKDTLWLN